MEKAMLTNLYKFMIATVALVGAVFSAATPTRAADLPLPTTPAETDSYFEKAFNAGDLDALMKMYDDRSILVGQPGRPAQGSAAIRQSLSRFLSLKLPISITIRNLYETGDTALVISDWVMAGKGADGMEVKLAGTTADVFKRQPAGNWIVAVDNPFGTARAGS
jgi:ketosteroid isomerase-like protein